MNVNWEGMLPISGDILVIEDDPTLRMLMAEILKEIGAKPLHFSNADDALTHLLSAHGHCAQVVVDQGLPGQIQGNEFSSMVKSKWPGVGSILTSDYTLHASDIPAGCTYPHKSWSLAELVVAVAGLLQPGSDHSFGAQGVMH